MSSSSLLLNVPPELLVEILSYLDPLSLAKARTLCKQIHHVVDNTASCQYKIELYIAGAENGSQYGQDVAGRLKRLKAFEEAWDGLRFTKRGTLRMERGGLWELYGGVLAQKTRESTYTFHRLQSKLRGIEGKSWTMAAPDFHVRDFGIEPSQDVLVLINTPQKSDRHTTHTLHVLSLEDAPGRPHPLAQKGGILQHVQDFEDVRTSYTIQVSGNLLGLLIHTHLAGENELVVWDWQSGEVVVDLEGDSIRSFSFLSDKHILLCSLLLPGPDDEDAVRIEPSLTVVDLEREGNSRRNLQDTETSISFRYPGLKPNSALVACTLRADPAPNWEFHPDPSVPFHLARDNRVYIVTLWVQTTEPTGQVTERLVFAIPGNTFMNQLDTNAQKTTGNTREWEEWGPTGSRLLLYKHSQSEVWVCFVHGSRYVALEARGERREGQYSCRVYDFNQPALRRSMRSAENDQIVVEEGKEIPTSDRHIYQLAPTSAPSTVFQRPVQTSLPYRWRSMPVGTTPLHLMCTEDHIIGVDKHENEYVVYSFE